MLRTRLKETVNYVKETKCLATAHANPCKKARAAVKTEVKHSI